jgi:hypothetical protein
MRVILGCEPNGFGPVSKLTAIANLLPEAERIFIGDAGADSYARRHPSAFERYLSTSDLAASRELLRSCDLALVVMEPDIAFELLQLGIPVYLFDSLLEFWVLPRGVAPLAEAARTISRLPTPDARALFMSFSIHERKVLAHMLADWSYAQNYPGVPRRLEEIRRSGFGDISLLGSMIDVPNAPFERRAAPARRDWRMLINLGGVQNFAIQFHVNDFGIDLMERWAEGFLARDPTCREITLCCGRYGAPVVSEHAGGRLVKTFARHDDFIAQLATADVVLTAAGRTTIHEAVHLGQLPILLPELHRNHRTNMDALRGTGLERFMVGLDDVAPMGPLPDDDGEGTFVIIEAMGRLLQDPEGYRAFEAGLDARVAALRALSPAGRRLILERMRESFRGQDFAAVVRGLAARHAPAPRLAVMEG